MIGETDLAVKRPITTFYNHVDSLSLLPDTANSLKQAFKEFDDWVNASVSGSYLTDDNACHVKKAYSKALVKTNQLGEALVLHHPNHVLEHFSRSVDSMKPYFAGKGHTCWHIKKAAQKSVDGIFSFEIKGNERAGNNTKIVISIAKVFDLNLSDFAKIFHRINQHTLSKPYPIGDKPIKVEDYVVYRPNHNGLHAVRQVCMLEELFSIIEIDGLTEAQDTLDEITSLEKENLRLAMCCMRAGRVDESSHKDPLPDDHYTRSAMIYKVYARQFVNISEASIQWGIRLIKEASKPSQEWILEDDVSMLVYTLFSIAHTLDKVRYSSWSEIEQDKRSIEGFLKNFVNNPVESTERLYSLSKNLCKATGSPIKGDGIKRDDMLFAACSNNGALCWEIVQQVR